jgi:PIN domain nuclease of toxin-antitoxin system
MIILDTHIWVWWAAESGNLSEEYQNVIESQRNDGIGVSAISCWEISKLVEYDRLELTLDLSDWMRAALDIPGVQLIDLSPPVAIESTQLPGDFHSDPADQIIVATARMHDAELVTVDQKIQDYAHVPVL